ncbi:hypothetical protein [Mycobacterium camsae]|uniref:hypothetical protein n=1 Tax=Mycobacterium gordonae TaxID=1778 RepID=UPI00197F4091|nr:hypothetical protein [Mycobacterium gordonae]
MNRAHTDVGPELRRLAQAILDGIDPAVRAAAGMAAGGAPGKCQQVWCPVCALAAAVSGEQHPLVTVIADHSVALLQVIQSIVDDIDRSAVPPADEAGESDGAGEPPAPATNGKPTTRIGYQAIPVTLQE